MSQRDKLIQRAEDLHRYLTEQEDLIEEVEEIFIRNGACEDDTDPDEGFFVTMSNQQIYNAIRDLVGLKNSESRDTIELVLSSNEYTALFYALTEYKSKHPEYSNEINKVLDQL